VAGEGELLKIEDEIAGGEKEVVGELDVEGGLHGRNDGVAVFIDEKDADGVEAFLFLAKEDAQGDGALGVHGWERPGDDGVEGAEEAKFTFVIDRGIAKGGDLDFHRGKRLRERGGICNTGGGIELLGKRAGMG
jgi:hypothetical protein